jgi:hypothetical protein
LASVGDTPAHVGNKPTSRSMHNKASNAPTSTTNQAAPPPVPKAGRVTYADMLADDMSAPEVRLYPALGGAQWLH